MAAHADAAVANATSCPAARSASANGIRGCQWPEPGLVVNRTRNVASGTQKPVARGYSDETFDFAATLAPGFYATNESVALRSKPWREPVAARRRRASRLAAESPDT